MTSELAGARVLEIGEMVTAPYAAKMLADMGAEVIKVERPLTGDRARAMGPFPSELPEAERSGLFLYLNTNKLGITLDIANPEGFRVLERLLADTDILIHNVHPPEMDRIGLSYARVRSINPSIIMTSITPFGLTGPYRNYVAEDLTTWNAGGAGYTNGTGDTDPVVPPLRPFGSPSSFAGGAHAAVATMGALIGRDLSGEGEHVEVAVQEVVTAMASNIMTWPYTGKVQTRLSFNLTQPLEAMEARGGWIWLQALEEHQWDKFVVLMGTPEWAGRPDFATNVLRTANWAQLRPLVREWVSQQDVLDLCMRAQARRIPFAPLSTMHDLLESGHLDARSFFIELDHPVAGRLKYPGALAKFPDSPWCAHDAAPTLGQHNERILRDRLGMSVAELANLRRSGAI